MSLFNFFARNKQCDIEDIINEYGYELAIGIFADIARLSFEDDFNKKFSQLADFIGNEIDCAKCGDSYAQNFATRTERSEAYQFMIKNKTEENSLNPNYDAQDVLNELFFQAFAKYGSKLRCDTVERILILEHQLALTFINSNRIPLSCSELISYQMNDRERITNAVSDILSNNKRFAKIAYKAYTVGHPNLSA